MKLRAKIDGKDSLLEVDDRAWLAVPRTQCWTLGQVAWVLQVDPRTVRRMVDAQPPKLPFFRVNGELRFSPDDVLSSIAGRKFGFAAELGADATLWQKVERLTFLLTRRDLRRTHPIDLEADFRPQQPLDPIPA